MLSFMLNNYLILLTLALIPLVFNMYNSLKTYTCGGDVKEFYFRLLKARNLMVYYSILLTVFYLLSPDSISSGFFPPFSTREQHASNLIIPGFTSFNLKENMSCPHLFGPFFR